MNRIKIDLEHTLGNIDHNIFGGFAEHLKRCIYGGIYDPDSPLADEDGLRSDVREALQHLNFPIVRYPGGNFVSGYRWRDGIGPRNERPGRHDLAWNNYDSNQFGTNEFIKFCRKLNIEPYLCTNCGDGDMREAADWVEYCNGTGDSALVKLRRKHGFEEPHKVKYWGIGNEVDSPEQIGYKTPQEYARAVTEFGKVMKRVDPDIKLAASATCAWRDFVERGQLMLEQAGNLIDYMALHWYVGNPPNDFNAFMIVSELYEERLSAYEGLIRAVSLDRGIKRPIYITVDEWGILLRAGWESPERRQFYALEDALVTAMNLNAFIRHTYSVRMANLTMIVSPMRIRPDGLVLQTTFYPFELYRHTCGQQALDVFWSGETFAGTYQERHFIREYTGVRILDVTATLDESQEQLVIYVVNRSQKEAMETTISLADGQFVGSVKASVVNGPDIKAENTFEKPNQVGTRETALEASGKSFTYSFEPHSVTALVCAVS
ncbi:Intracellular exo-alpha-(1-_5)-L-arabinofuranosidase 1 [subsurface metagenome]